jgi:ABC-type amino acid transport system permease subunit
MIKNSAIMGGSLLALDDLLHVARVVNSKTFNPVGSFLPATIGYLILTISATFAVRYSERRFVVRR